MASPAEVAEQAPGQQVLMVEQLRELGFIVIDVTGRESWMGPALEPATGLAGQRDINSLYSRAFSDPAKAEAKLTGASRAAQAAVSNDKGTITTVTTPKSYVDGRLSHSLVVGGVDDNGTVFVGRRAYGSNKERRGLQNQIDTIGSSPTQRKGVTANLLSGRSTGNLVNVIGTSGKLALPRQRSASEPSLIDQLGQLDPELVFNSTFYGYSVPGLSYPEAVLDPEMAAHNRMLHIARLGGTIGRAALGLRPQKAAELFAEEPAVWQSLAHLGHELPSTEIQTLQALVASASERLATRPEQLSVGDIADLVGSALLAKRAPNLRPAISAKLASMHTRPEPLPEPTPPGRLELLSVPKFAIKKATKVAKAAALNTNAERTQSHAQATAAYNAAKARFDQRADQITNYDIEHPRIEQRGGQMLAKLMKWYTRRGTSKVERFVHADTNSNKFSLSDITDVIQNPAQLRATYERVRMARRGDRVQVFYRGPKEWAKARAKRAAVGTAHALSSAARATADLRERNKQARAAR